jgi:hypothetical protein
LFGVSHPQRRVPPDFGVPLNPATIEPALARLRADRLTYLRRNPDDASWIRSLVGVAHYRDSGVVAASGD